jgi:hypothetical protein
VWLIDTSGLNPNPTNSLYLNGGAGTLSVSDVTGPN